ncbi:hypothetical protein ACNTMW_12845 [Planosporangium sp. 12N6]|uniref:hypothetical protein n=1 Tax=Planosporangium spinosum TaxID=3402278 RepID=UPI003CEF95A8
MTTVERLLTLATAYAEAAARAGRSQGLTLSTDTDADETATRAETQRADAEVARRRAELRTALAKALRPTVHAVPDTELPVCTHIRGVIEVRGTFDRGERGVRVRYTPAQALAAGAALIACAAITDDREGGTLTGILAAFPANPPAAGTDTPTVGRRA